MEKQLNYDKNNILTIGGLNALSLVKKFGSPLYIFDETEFRQKCNMFCEILNEVYPNSHVSYASKAFCCKAIYNILKEALYEFPVLEVNVNIPDWIACLSSDNWLKKIYIEKIKSVLYNDRKNK